MYFIAVTDGNAESKNESQSEPSGGENVKPSKANDVSTQDCESTHKEPPTDDNNDPTKTPVQENVLGNSNVSKDVAKIETASTSSVKSNDTSSTKSKSKSVSSNKSYTKGLPSEKSDNKLGSKPRTKSSKSEAADDLEIVGATVAMTSRGTKERNMDINRETKSDASAEDRPKETKGKADKTLEVAF